MAFESCSGYKQTFQVDETIDPVLALSEQYLSIPCSVMSPNQGRIDLLNEMIREFSVDGVVDLTWQACHTYNMDTGSCFRSKRTLFLFSVSVHMTNAINGKLF